MAENNVNNIKNKPVVQTDRNGQVITVYPGNGRPMIMIEPKQINTLSEDKNGK